MIRGRVGPLAPAALPVALVLLAGCARGPEYRRPAAAAVGEIPQAFAEEASATGVSWASAAPADAEARGDWWRLFGDAELDQIEKAVVSANPTVAEAQARYFQAAAAARIARAGFFPDVAAPAAGTRQRESYSFPNNGRESHLTPTYNTITVALEAGWEPDIWGRVRRQVEGARARLDAGRATLESVRLMVTAEAAADYFSLRAQAGQRRLLLQTREAYRKALDLTRHRREGGVGTDLDVAQAETQLRTVEAEIPALDLDAARLRHALAALSGRTGADLPPAAGTPLPEPMMISGGVPSRLLEQRPDIAAAERRMMAANADVGVAQAAFFPSFRIGGLAGFESLSVDNLLGLPNRYWSVGPSLTLPIFTGGRLRGGLASARAAYDEAVASYRQTVVGAFREVEDQLAAERHLAEEQAALKLGLAAARRTLEIATNRYEAGLVTYLEVTTAQSAAFQLERRVVELQGERWLATVGLVRAVGGGWRGLTPPQR